MNTCNLEHAHRNTAKHQIHYYQNTCSWNPVCIKILLVQYIHIIIIIEEQEITPDMMKIMIS